MLEVLTVPISREMVFLQKESKFAVGLKFQQHEVQTELSLGNGTQVVPTAPF